LRRLEALSVVSVLAVFLVSCATAPRISEPPPGGASFETGSGFSVLPPGARLYLWADVKEARPLLDVLSIGTLDGKDAAGILERTDIAEAAFYPEEAGRSFFLAGWGSYPVFSAGISMAFSRDWKKVKSPTGNRYWYSKNNNLGVAIGSNLAYAAAGDPWAGVPGEASTGGETVQIPEGFETFRSGCVLAGWMPEPQEPINRFLAAAELPIQFPAEQFFFGAAKVQSGDEDGGSAWELVFRMRAPSAAQARALATLFAMARMFIGGATGGEGLAAILPVLFANQPVQEGNDVIIRLPAMTAEETALLFSTFSVYFNQVQ
jgi:hypothetical protein